MITQVNQRSAATVKKATCDNSRLLVVARASKRGFSKCRLAACKTLALLECDKLSGVSAWRGIDKACASQHCCS